MTPVAPLETFLWVPTSMEELPTRKIRVWLFIDCIEMPSLKREWLVVLLFGVPSERLVLDLSRCQNR